MGNTTSTELGKKKGDNATTTRDIKVGISPGLAHLRHKLGEKAQKEPRFRY
jgi:hypothetical protein